MKKGGLAIMLGFGKKKGMSGHDDEESSGSDSSLGDGEDYGDELVTLTKKFFELGGRGKYEKAASIFKEMHAAAMEDHGSDDDEEDDEE